MLSALSRQFAWLRWAFVLTAGSLATVAHADEDEVPFSEVRIILETNATDCDTGIQLFFDGDPWRYAEIEDPNERRVLRVAARGRLKGFGLTEQFNESNEPVMEELVAANPLGDCEDGGRGHPSVPLSALPGGRV